MKQLTSFLKKWIKYLLFSILSLLLFLGALFLWGFILYSEGYNTPLTNSQIKAVELIGSQNDIFVTDSGSIRRTWNTLMSIPEWYIVSISDDYTRFLELGNNPSDFPYFSYINDYWRMYGEISHILDVAWVSHDSEYHTMVRVIGVSTALEFSIKGIYENTLLRLVVWSFLYSDITFVCGFYLIASMVWIWFFSCIRYFFFWLSYPGC